MRILDVGCGNNKTPGAIGLDINPRTQADLIADLDAPPYPFADNSFDLIVANHVIEHVRDAVAFMEELHRLLRPGGLVRLVTPHYTNPCAYADLTHRRYLSLRALDGFTSQAANLRVTLLGRLLETDFPAMDFYSLARFEKVEARLSFGRPFRYLGVQWLANRWPRIYEFYLAGLFPARDIYLTLRAVK